MKTKYIFLKVITLLLYNITAISQSKGDIAFVYLDNFNNYFSIVALNDISANSVIYFSDNEPNSTTSLNAGGGVLEWNSGSETITQGAIISFYIPRGDSNKRISSCGYVTVKSSGFTIGTPDAIYAYIKDSSSSSSLAVDTWLAGISSDSSAEGGLSHTGLDDSTYEFINAYDSSSTTFALYYDDSRTNQSSFSDYTSNIGDDTKWSQITTSKLFSFSKEAFTLNSNDATWVGGATSKTATNWNVAANWSPASIPTLSTTVTIPSTTNDPIINIVGAEAGNIIIESSASLTINSSKNLNVKGRITNNGTLTVKSNATGNASLIVGDFDTSTSGTNTIESFITTEWHLITSPVKDMKIGEFHDQNTLEDNGTLLGLASYDNDYTGSTGWDYIPNTITSSYSITLTNRRGYAVNLDDTSGDRVVNYTGEVFTDLYGGWDASDGDTNNWFLAGNPYPAHMSINAGSSSGTETDTALNFLDFNTEILDDSYEAIYIWDSSTSSYTIVNNSTTDAEYLAPGQGFFILFASSLSSSELYYTKSMLSHQTGDLFYKTSKKKVTIPQISLSLSDGVLTKKTAIKYFPDTSTGLDPGYDAGMFNGTSNSFAVYTHLINDSKGINMGIQCLPNSDYENMVVPVGVNATAGKELTFNVDAQNIPSGYKVYLEDKNDGSFTRLDESNSEYKVTLSSDLNGIGRFYLHTRTSVLSTDDDIQLDAVSIYPTSKNTLRITGLKEGANQLSMYNILGKKVFNSNFDSKPVNDINIPNVKTGVYIIQLKTAYGNVNKKVVLR